MARQSIIICLIGLPGSGKGTQGRLIADKTDWPYFAVGNLVREIYNDKKKDNFHNRVRSRYDKGIPQPDSVINKIVRDKIAGLKRFKGLILDAYPLSEGQVKGLARIMKELKILNFYTIYLEITDAEAARRLGRRKICKACGTPYTVIPAEGKCSVCGGELISRPDDKPKTVKARVKKYKQLLAPIASQYRLSGHLVAVDGNQSISAVHEDILASLKTRGIII
ncbi:MAG: nucleoside monophosphate kinase [Parcubacteria group bacterium]|nr:nucleoside monophosphate kinase [Parcubacteria group bacterium]